MNETIRLGSIRGIRVGIHWTLLVIFGLLTWSLAGGQLPHAAPGHPNAAYWFAALGAALLFYGCLLAHELAHAFVARHRHIEVEGIVLWLLGGASKLKGEAADPDGEFRIAIAGPATSMVLALAFFGLSRLAGAGHPASLLAGVLGWLGWINGLLAVFNLLPAFPLDGGRILRSALWRRYRDKAAATAVAARAGAAFGYGFVGLGIIGFLASGGGFDGLWLALIGWFLLSASRSEAQASALTGQVAVSLVRDAMTPNPLTVPTWVTLDRLMEEGVYKRRLSSFPVVDTDDRFAGLVTLARMNRIPPERWNHVTAGWIASPVAETVTASPDDELMSIAEQMLASADRRAVILADGHKVVGILAPQAEGASSTTERRHASSS